MIFPQRTKEKEKREMSPTRETEKCGQRGTINQKHACSRVRKDKCKNEKKNGKAKKREVLIMLQNSVLKS